MYSISIQAGGQSKRMGANKAMIEFEGVPLVRRILARVQPLAEDVFVTSNAPDEFSDLGVTIYQDVYRESCALSGLITALTYARNEAVVVIACDMPFVVPELVVRESELLLNMDVDVVLPRTRKGLEPLLAAYRVSTCLPATSNALKSGNKRMVSWFDRVKVHEMGEDVIRLYDPDLRSFININTPEELRQAQILAKIFN